MPIDPFELVRRWFEAFNAGDLDGLAALYHEDATNDSGGEVTRGREAVKARDGGRCSIALHGGTSA